MTTYAGELYERHEKNDGSVEHLLRVTAGGRTVAEVAFQAPSAGATPARSERYLHPDHLGSPDVITGGDGRLLERRSYAPFGQRRPADWSNNGPAPAPLTTGEGFTGHEEDDELGLVYMKGRTYDPKLGRFLQQDPFVQAPAFSQSWNPYAYVLNNPLTLVDPSGYEWYWCHWCTSEGTWADVTPWTNGPGYQSVVYWEGGSQVVALIPDGSRTFSSGPTNGDVAEGSWAWGRGDGAPQAGRERSEGVGGPDRLSSRLNGGPSSGPSSGAYPASPSDARARELAREFTKAWNARGGELIEKAAFAEMMALQVIWEGVAFQAAGALARSLLTRACFVAGTEVWTADGLVPIEQVAPGQLVLSRDEATGELGWKRVVRTFVTPGQETLALALADDERGEHEQVEATAEHPFWLEGQGWVGAGSLVPGQRVLRADGRWLRVERVEARPGRRTVYNLEVETYHTYMVGRLGAWVHNMCPIVETIKKVVSPRALRPTHLPDSKSAVNRLAKIIKNEGYKPSEPIRAVEAQGALYIRDGHHRAAAAIKAGVREVEVEVTQAGSLEEAKQLFREWTETLTDGGWLQMAASEHPEHVVEEFSRLQAGLVTYLLATVPFFDREYFKDLSDGSMEFEGKTWSYRRHGAGVTFRSTGGVTVNAHVGMADYPAAIDAWRMYDYLDSLGVQEIAYCGELFVVDGEKNVDRMLKKMAAAGVLRVMKDRRHPNRSYYFPMAG